MRAMIDRSPMLPPGTAARACVALPELRREGAAEMLHRFKAMGSIAIGKSGQVKRISLIKIR